MDLLRKAFLTTKITKVFRKMSYILCFSQLFFVYFVTFVVNHFVIQGEIFMIHF